LLLIFIQIKGGVPRILLANGENRKMVKMGKSHVFVRSRNSGNLLPIASRRTANGMTGASKERERKNITLQRTKEPGEP